MIIKLDEETKKILQLWYPNLDLDKIKIIKGGLVNWLWGKLFNYAAAVTLGQRIYFVKPASCDLAMLVHELKHVDQQREMGEIYFNLKYILDFILAGFKYSQNLPLEKSAHQIAEEFLKDQTKTG